MHSPFCFALLNIHVGIKTTNNIVNCALNVNFFEAGPNMQTNTTIAKFNEIHSVKIFTTNRLNKGSLIFFLDSLNLKRFEKSTTSMHIVLITQI